METAKYLTLGQASKETGVSKPTLSKALKSGKVSYIEKTKAGYKIDPSELFRVYPRKPENITDYEQLDTPSYGLDNRVLQGRLETQEKLMSRLEDEIDDLRKQRDKWEAQANSQTRLLENHSTHLGWFDRILGRK